MPNLSEDEVKRIVNSVINESSLDSDEKAKLLLSLNQVDMAAKKDRWIYRVVVGFLGAALILTIVGGFVSHLTHQTEPIPDVLVAIGSASVGALAGLLAPSPRRD